MRFEDSFEALGTRVRMVIRSEDAVDQAVLQSAANHVRHLVATWEQRWSRFRADSEISRANARAGEWVEVSPQTAAIVRRALQAWRDTGGLFHPALGRHLAEAGYDRSWRELKAQDAAAASTSERRYEPAIQAGVEVSDDDRYLRVVPGYALDLGGIGKGWIVECAARCLRRLGFQHFIVDAGGDMVCAGEAEAGPWRIGVTDPAHPDQDVAVLEVRSLAVATSGIYRRRWPTETGDAHHIVDPRTGRPARTDVSSCTVIGPDLVALEVLAKCCILLGAEGAEAVLRRHAPHGWLLIRTDGQVRHAWMPQSPSS